MLTPEKFLGSNFNDQQVPNFMPQVAFHFAEVQLLAKIWTFVSCATYAFLAVQEVWAKINLLMTRVIGNWLFQYSNTKLNENRPLIQEHPKITKSVQVLKEIKCPVVLFRIALQLWTINNTVF